MYIRRKVFSLLSDEMGEERYFSTTEYVKEEEPMTDEEWEAENKKHGKAVKGTVGHGSLAATNAAISGYLVKGAAKKGSKAKPLAIIGAGVGLANTAYHGKKAIEHGKDWRKHVKNKRYMNAPQWDIDEDETKSDK